MNVNKIHIPACILVEHVMPFVDDRQTWNNVSMTCRYIHNNSKHILARPWPQKLSLPQGTHHSMISSIAFSSDGRYLASGSFSQIDIWDRTHGHIHQLRSDQANPIRGRVLCIGFSPDNKWIGICSTESNPLVWNLSTKEVLTIPLFENVGHRAKRISFLNNRKNNGNTKVVCASSHGVWNYDVRTGRCHSIFSLGIARWYAHLISIATGPPGSNNNSNWLATSEDHAGQVKLVNMNDTGKSLVIYHNADYITDVAFSKDYVATGGDHGIVQIWDRQDGTQVDRLYGLTSNITSMAFHPDGMVLAGADDGGNIIVSTENGEFCLTPTPSPPTGTSSSSSKSGINKITFTPDGSMLVAAGNDGKISFWTRSIWESQS